MSQKPKYPPQPVNPKRTPGQSVTWVRNLDHIQNNPRRVVVIKKSVPTVPVKNK